jgi:2-polyprenyl-3-methyl-5-hydroxy-6-metoxy-1,4-benzoquinol methylase
MAQGKSMVRPLTSTRARELVSRYRDRTAPPPYSYATVEDFCDSVDNLPQLTGLQGDLKDVQRPWTAKALLNLVAPGSTLIEIGAGRPEVAQLLADCGYNVIAVDPYEGAGHGPTEYEAYKQHYPRVKIVKRLFEESLDLPQADAIYSISTLEHLPDLQPVFRAIVKHLKPGGLSLHSVDIVTQGNAADWHHQLARNTLAFHGAGDVWDSLLEQANRDLETYWLGPSGHQLWRGKTPYKDFPFRKVLSLQTHARTPDLLLPNL